VRTSDQASPTPASPAIATGTAGAAATVTIDPAMTAAARVIARGPGAPRAAPKSAPAKLPGDRGERGAQQRRAAAERHADADRVIP
jgi:hypothetical protein